MSNYTILFILHYLSPVLNKCNFNLNSYKYATVHDSPYDIIELSSPFTVEEFNLAKISSCPNRKTTAFFAILTIF